MKAPVMYFGGKRRLSSVLVGMIPKHRIYVEVFGGGAALLFAKDSCVSELEVYNDLDEGAFNFFKVLRDKKKAKALVAALRLTPYSRREHTACKTMWAECADEVEKARMWFVAISQAFANRVYSGWSYTCSYSNPCILDYAKSVARAAERFRNVQVDNLDWRDIIDKYDSPDTFFYMDPPYIGETRVESVGVYNTEFSSVGQHAELVNVLLEVNGLVMLSGYKHSVYAPLDDAGWHRVDVSTSSSARVGGSSVKAGGKIVALKRVDSVWMNYRLSGFRVRRLF